MRASAYGDRVELRVVDTGPGVPRKEHDRLFTAFQRLGDRRAAPGVGLGLHVARGFGEAMGGTLDAEDTPGGGLTMVLSLPVAPHRPDRDPRRADGRGRPARRRPGPGASCGLDPTTPSPPRSP